MSFDAQLLHDLELGNDITGYGYRSYHAASSHPSPTHYRNESTPVWKTTLHFSAPVLLVVAGIIYTLLHAYDHTWLSLSDLAWNYIVHFTPYKLVVIFDKEAQAASLGASKFSTSVSHAQKSAMMRRIIGLDKPGGIIGTVAQAGRRRLSILPGLSLRGGDGGDDIRPAGLGNWDNSCYQNSVLQGLASLNGFDAYLLGPYGKEAQDDGSDSGGSDSTIMDESPGSEMRMANSLHTLIQKLNDPANNGTRLWTPSALKSMSSWQQQDAQEYFSKVLDEIDKEIERAALAAKPTSPGLSASLKPGGRSWNKLTPQVKNPLEGFLAQRVACCFCGHTEGLSLIPFTNLTLSLPSCSSGKLGSPYSVADLLDRYTQLEFIDDVNCGKCSVLQMRRKILWLLQSPKLKKEGRLGGIRHLKAVEAALADEDFEEKTLKGKCRILQERERVDSTKSRQAVVARPPKSLVIHINRSMFDENTGELSKNHAPVKFDKELDLGPWCLGSASCPSSASKGIQGPDEEDWTTNPQRSMICRGTPDTSNQLRDALAMNYGWFGGSLSNLPPKKSMIHGPIYTLRAMIIHQGRHENGHYITFKKYPVPVACSPPAVEEMADSGAEEMRKAVNLNGKEEKQTTEEWFRISDDDVQQVSEKEVMAQRHGVFMLFYDQVEPATRVDAVSNPSDAGAWPLPQPSPPQNLEAENEAENLKVASLVEHPTGDIEDEEADRQWLEELDILSLDGDKDFDDFDIGSPDTTIYGSPDTAVCSPDSVIYDAIPEVKREISWAGIEKAARESLPSRVTPTVTAPVLQLRPGNVQNSVVDANDLEPTSTTSPSQLRTAKPMETVMPIIVKPYIPKSGKESELTERGGGRGRKVSVGGLLMV